VKVTVAMLVAVLGLGVCTVPLVTDAQQTGNVYRVGYLTVRSDGSREQLFEQALRERGWRLGEDVVITYRGAEGNYVRLAALARELVRLEPLVIVAVPTAAARAARDATSTIPIVMWGVADPVGDKLIASLARPAGNVTGVTGTLPSETYSKQLQLLKETAPHARRIGLLWNAANPASPPGVRAAEWAARSLGVDLQVVVARAPGEFEAAFRALSLARADALLVMQDALFASHFTQIADLSIKRRLPTMSGLDGYAKAGGLMNYAVSDAESARQVAGYVDRLLRRAKPGELPVEQPRKFELVINLKTAKTLGLTVPPSLLLQADQVIE
jgi:putative ABC transport system substrate-binding protein